MEKSEHTLRLRAAEECSKYVCKFPDITAISASEIKLLKRNGTRVHLVDVRDFEERSVSMIEGAISVQEFEYAHNNHIYGPEACSDVLIVPYCTIGYRSGLYAQELIKRGYSNVRNGEGIIMWTHDIGSGIVDKSGMEVKRVHVYGPPWNLASSEYEPIEFGVKNSIVLQFRKISNLLSRKKI